METIKLNLEDILNEKIPQGQLCAGSWRMTNAGNAIFTELEKAGFEPLFHLRNNKEKPLKFEYIEILPANRDMANKYIANRDMIEQHRNRIAELESQTLWQFIKARMGKLWKKKQN